MVLVLIGVVALVQIPVELLKENVTMMMIVKVISYVAQTTVSLHSHHQQTAAMTHFQVSKEFLESLQKKILSNSFYFGILNRETDQKRK